ncbi:hypothetical protein Y032_0174g437 [Ancylostoma ceylanicum]|uniref:Uncharacterized protein n=1 Tax=Ancylostoma ceylanicum TaxID=53326 RepID=A0A016SV22_9BILA|nr:hypothetical protein Y032_0174g437 [Ancylostoma ceylanicum]
MQALPAGSLSRIRRLKGVSHFCRCGVNAAKVFARRQNTPMINHCRAPLGDVAERRRSEKVCKLLPPGPCRGSKVPVAKACVLFLPYTRRATSPSDVRQGMVVGYFAAQRQLSLLIHFLFFRKSCIYIVVGDRRLRRERVEFLHQLQ